MTTLFLAENIVYFTCHFHYRAESEKTILGVLLDTKVSEEIPLVEIGP